MTEGNRNIMDPTGWIAEKLEWFITYYFFANDEVHLHARHFDRSSTACWHMQRAQNYFENLTT